MKRFLMIIVIMGLSLASVSAQVNSGVASSPPRELLLKTALPAASRARVVGRNEQAVSPQKGAIPDSNHARTNGSNNQPNTSAVPTTTEVVGHAAVPSSQVYRVGVGDVLDVQLADMPTAKSTLFTVLEGGVLDYPLAGGSVVVAGLTAEEIATRLQSRIKVLENPKIVVKVRDYISHNVIVTGLVSDPGAKFLRRETIPLYVVLVEAQPRPEAVSVSITRAGQAAIKVDLSDQKAMSTLVVPGDVIKVVGSYAAPPSFFYAGGALNSPGQKSFHAGLTLTQAILASGGITRDAGSKVKVSRQGADGRLTTSEYNLRQIQDGKAADPILQRGDRITVAESR
jgi:protein involved in polysaccharide export with SLBB domain